MAGRDDNMFRDERARAEEARPGMVYIEVGIPGTCRARFAANMGRRADTVNARTFSMNETTIRARSPARSLAAR